MRRVFSDASNPSLLVAECMALGNYYLCFELCKYEDFPTMIRGVEYANHQEIKGDTKQMAKFKRNMKYLVETLQFYFMQLIMDAFYWTGFMELIPHIMCQSQMSLEKMKLPYSYQTIIHRLLHFLGSDAGSMQYIALSGGTLFLN